MRRISTVIVLLVALATAAPASAASESPVVGDCVAHGQLTQTYTLGQLRTGLSTMSADVKEYTNCFDVIQRALNTALATVRTAHGSTSGSGSGGSFLPTPVIVILVVLALAVVTFGAISLRRRGQFEDDGEPPADAGGPPGDQ